MNNQRSRLKWLSCFLVKRNHSSAVLSLSRHKVQTPCRDGRCKTLEIIVLKPSIGIPGRRTRGSHTSIQGCGRTKGTHQTGEIIEERAPLRKRHETINPTPGSQLVTLSTTGTATVPVSRNPRHSSNIESRIMCRIKKTLSTVPR